MFRALTFSILALALPSCMQVNNSSQGDMDKFGRSVNSVFIQNCTPCHSFESMSVNDLVAAGQLVRGDALNSKIYYRISGSNGTNGPKDMPQGGSLSTTDLAAIEAWIAGL